MADTVPAVPALPLPPLRRERLDEIVRAFAPWRLRDEEGVWPAGAGVAREAEMGEGVGAGPGGVVRLWRGARSLVVTRREARLPRFAEARAALEAHGWPVVVRDSGGTTVPHLSGALQVSVFLPGGRTRGIGIEDVYHLLAEPVRAALRVLGLRTGYGEVPGSFCDGRYNLVHGGRKLAGTAQRWKGGAPGAVGARGYVLGHMVLFVQGDLAEATEAVNRLLHRAGGEDRFDPATLVTVEEALHIAAVAPPHPRDGTLVEQVRGALRAVLERRLPGLRTHRSDGREEVRLPGGGSSD